MIYLIGGAPRVGKSVLATELALKLSVELFSTDDLDIYPKNFPSQGFSGTPTNNKLTPKERLEFEHKKAYLYDLKITDIVSKALEENRNIIIEGVHLYPKYARWLIDQYGSDKFRSIFIGSRNKEQIVAGMKLDTNPNNWLKDANREVRSQVADYVAVFSEFLCGETARYNLQYFERTSDFQEDMKYVINYFVKGE